MTTPYHAKYFAHELTRQAQPGGADRLSMALFDACVDLNPHQIDAAGRSDHHERAIDPAIRHHDLPAEDYVLQKFSIEEEASLAGSDSLLAQATSSAIKLIRSLHT